MALQLVVPACLPDRPSHPAVVLRPAALPRLYKGVSVSQKRCLECGGVRESVEDIYGVTVAVKGFPDVVSSLAQATNYEDLVDGNAVECPMCLRKVWSPRSTWGAHVRA